MKRLSISISTQLLSLYDDDELIKTYPISSAKNGIGSEEGSYKTPIGHFIIDEKHGHRSPLHTIFKSRKPHGVWNNNDISKDDLVLTRILWLAGLDQSNLNTKQRYIYIHGTNHEDLIGTPQSCGCIRMKNTDVVELFELCDVGTKVFIQE